MIKSDCKTCRNRKECDIVLGKNSDRTGCQDWTPRKFSYGLPYKGSKNSIADWIVDNLPPSLFLIDLFAGGCAVTHAAMRRGTFLGYLVNDINEAPQVFYKALFGEYDDPHYKQFVSREMFFGANDMALKLMWSFGNDGKTYIYGKEIEHYKKLCHFQRLGICDVMDFIKADPHYKTHRWTNCQSAMNWLRIHNIPLSFGDDLENIRNRITATQASYDDVPIPSKYMATVYCDIPYKTYMYLNTICLMTLNLLQRDLSWLGLMQRTIQNTVQRDSLCTEEDECVGKD